MILSSKTYDFLKWLALLALPAIAIFVNTVAPLWGMSEDLVKAIVITINALGVLIGTLIGVSQANISKYSNNDVE